MRDYSPALIHASSRADGPTIRRDADCAAPILLLYAEEYGEVEYGGLPVKPSYLGSTASASSDVATCFARMSPAHYARSR